MAQEDTLNTRQIARIVDLLSEGKIAGFPSAIDAGLDFDSNSAAYNVAALKDVFFNNTPILQPDTTVTSSTTLADVQQFCNFDVSEANFETRLGRQNQPVTEIIEQEGNVSYGWANQQEFQVNTEVPKADATGQSSGTYVANGTPVTRTITDTNVTAVRITVGTPALQKVTNKGDQRGSFIDFKVEADYNGAGFNEIPNSPFKIEGRTPDLFQKVVNFPITGSFPVTIRVTRTTQEVTTNDTITDTLIWYSYTEKINDRFRYPNSALFALKVDAQQFPQIPDRAYRIRGMTLRVPHNATISSTGRITYSGTFNGTFKAAREWTNDPAWVLWDLLTNTRYGLGKQILTAPELDADFAGTFDGVASNLDIYSFYKASQYCNGLVRGEARFSCNTSIQTSTEAYDLVQQLCSVFRAMPFWSEGALAIAQDAPEDFAYVFNQTNVTEGGFNYSGSSLKTRHTCVSVKYFDLNLRDYVYELVEDEEAIKKYGYIKTQINAFACTSQGQAHRLGRWLLYTEQNESEVVSFETDIAAGITVRPGDYIKIGDPVRAGITVAGRIADGSTTTSIKVDRSDTQMFGASAPNPFTLNVVLPNQTVEKDNNCSIVGNTITPGAAFSQAPVKGAPFAIGYTSGEESVVLSTWRVVSVEENKDTFGVTAVAHNPSKYNAIELDRELTQRDVSILNDKPEAPTNLDVQEVLYESAGTVLQKLVIGWQQARRANKYRVRYRLDNDNFTTVETSVPDLTIQNSDVGVYTIEVTALNYGFARTIESLTASTTFTAVGKTAPPSNIASLNITPIDQHNAELHWPQSTDLDVRVGGTVEIRHTPHTDANATWGRSQKIVPAVNGSSTRKIVPLKSGTFFIRAKDSVGNYSALAGIPTVQVALPEPQDLEVVQTFTENPAFGGTFTNVFNNTVEGGITLGGKGLVDDITDFDAVTDIDFFGGIQEIGEYIFTNTLDVNQVYDVELLANLQVRSYNPDDFWDSRTDLIDTWTDIDADDFNETDAELYVRSTNDDPSGSPTYGTWEPFINSTKRGRGFQFKVQLETDSNAQDILIEQLGVTVSLQRRTEQQRNISTGTSAKAITFPSAFYSTPSVTVTATNMASGDFFELTSVSRTGFTIATKDSGGTIVDRNIDYQAVGHGKEIT
jgi:predicted phage tail protein